MRRVTILVSVVLVTALVSAGAWLQGAARGYELGKADAMRTMTPAAVVLSHPTGRCEVFDQPNQSITLQRDKMYRALPATLVMMR